MIEKPKRTKNILRQDRIQPTTIEELIRKYDLDNTKIYEYLDYLVKYLNDKNIDDNYIKNIIQEKIGVIDITNQYITYFTPIKFEVLYYPFYNKIEVRLEFDKIINGGWQTLAKPVNEKFSKMDGIIMIGYGSAGKFAPIRIQDNGEIQSYDTGNITFISGYISARIKESEEDSSEFRIC